jgi:hypothetical protein
MKYMSSLEFGTVAMWQHCNHKLLYVRKDFRNTCLNLHNQLIITSPLIYVSVHQAVNKYRFRQSCFCPRNGSISGKLHSFPTTVVNGVNSQHHATAALSSRENHDIHKIESWVGPRGLAEGKNLLFKYWSFFNFLRKPTHKKMSKTIFLRL